jgi:hypothetical protein
MDSEFKNLVLITTPLEKGASWTQKVINRDNVEVELECTITDVKDDGLKSYVVRYEQKQGDYYEEREIREETGVTTVSMLFVSGGDRIDIGYSLYGDASGYLLEREIKALLPPSMVEYRYFGLAEYAHKVTRGNTRVQPGQTIFEFNGVFEDGRGIPGDFKVRYVLDRNAFTITENVMENTREEEKKVNSILQGMVILKAPIKPGNSWNQQVELNDVSYTMNAVITSAQADEEAPHSVVYTVKYTVDGVPGYFNNRYIQERKFKTGRGMIAFSQLMPGDIGISGKELEDKQKVEQALANHMFGYSQDMTQ